MRPRILTTGLCLAAAVLVAATPVGNPRQPPSMCSEPDWQAAWAEPPSFALGTGPTGVYEVAPHGFAAQTLRLVVTPKIGADTIRLRLSNHFGDVPLTMSRVTVAPRTIGAAVDATRLAEVTFGGRSSVTLAPGERRTSDPVPFVMEAFDDLAVSVHFPTATGPPTGHLIGLQTSYVGSPGPDLTASPSASLFTRTTLQRFFLEAVDAWVDEPQGVVVAVGDSITDGDTTAPDTATAWPDQLARRFAAAASQMSVVNAGVSANQVAHDPPAGFVWAGPPLIERLDRDVIAQSGVTDVVLLEGINDIGLSAATATEVIEGLRTVVQRLQSAGINVILGTLVPFKGGFTYSDDGEVHRLAVNEWIRTSRAADAVVDFDAALRDPSAPDQLRPAYDSGDHLHPSAAGHAALAAAVDMDDLTGNRCQPPRTCPLPVGGGCEP